MFDFEYISYYILIKYDKSICQEFLLSRPSREQTLALPARGLQRPILSVQPTTLGAHAHPTHMAKILEHHLNTNLFH